VAPAVETLETDGAVIPESPRRRLVDVLREPANWLQLIQFGLVGASGFVINTGVYWLLLRRAGLHYIPSAVLAFCVAVCNNFFWNRVWTFRSTKDDSHAAFQLARFLTVSVAALLVDLVLLRIFVESLDMGKVVAQLIAVTLVMPISFIGNRLWSFR
jgi:dolichol-phosphate mannosyltransferase